MIFATMSLQAERWESRRQARLIPFCCRRRGSPRRRSPAAWYSSSSSIPIQRRPHWSAATQVEPEPANGSRIKSPGFVKVSISGCNTLTGFSVGWCRLPVYCRALRQVRVLPAAAGALWPAGRRFHADNRQTPIAKRRFW